MEDYIKEASLKKKKAQSFFSLAQRSTERVHGSTKVEANIIAVATAKVTPWVSS